MTLKWKKNDLGIYEGNTKTFNHETNKHESILQIMHKDGQWVLTEKHIEISRSKTLKEAKDNAQDIEHKKPIYITDEEEGMAHAHYAPGQTISSYITAQRISGRLYVSEDGKGIVSETRFPDGTIKNEYREY